MFRRSIQILLVATLVALAVIVGWAWRWPGAPEAMARAEQMLQRQEYARAIRELNLCERGRSCQQDAALRERLWRLRLAANTAIENHAGALQDVENLLRQRGDDADLQLERIRLMTATGDGERALRLAREFVADHPQHGRGLEVAAATGAALYGPELERLRQTIRNDLGADQVTAASAALATFVFRPDGDGEVAPSADELAKMYAVDTRLAARWPVLLRDLRAVRDQVQEGLDYCRRSLEAPGTPASAAVTWAEALDAGGRVDDMLAACEIQRRRSDGGEAIDAGLVAARSLLRRQANGACIATVARWLPPARLPARIAEDRLGDATPDLMLTRLIAAWRRDDVPALLTTLNDAQVLQRAGIKVPILQFGTAGLLHYRAQAAATSEQDTRNSEANLRYVATLLLREPLRDGWPDLLGLIMPLYIDLIQKLGNPEADVLNAFDAWQQARPDALAPRLAFARYLLAHQKFPAAASVLAEATSTHPTDAELFDLRLQLARADRSQADQDGAALLAQCLRRRSSTPEVAQPLGYMLCAEAALQARVWVVARDSARLAADAFPQLRAPRLLVIEGMLGGGEVAAAAQQARRLLELFPVDEAVAGLALRAYRAAGLPTAELLALALPVSAPNDELRTELLRAALADAPTTAATFAAPVATAGTAPPTLRLLAARALAIGGRPADGQALLASVIAESDALPGEAQLDLALAITDWLVASAQQQDDPALAPEVARTLARTDLRDEAAAPIFLQAAGRVAATHPRCAYELVARGLAIAAPAARDGAAFALAGRLASRLHLPRLAEEHRLAALAFADGLVAAEELARLHLAQGRADRALQVYHLVDPGTDAALAARCGAIDRAVAIAGRDAAADGADLLAQATLAALGQPSPLEWQAADVPTTELRLELLTLLRDPDLAAEALTRAQTLVRVQPDSRTNVLLLARASRLAGEPAVAADIHAALRSRAPDPCLWREVALAAADADYRPEPALVTDLVAAVVAGAVGGSPTTTTFGLRHLAEAFARDGNPVMAAAARETRWVKWPQATVTTDADVEAVAAMANSGSARYVLEQVLPGLTGRTRALARTRLYEHYDRILATFGSQAVDVYQAARRHLASEGPYGCIVQLLLDHGGTFPSLRPDADATRALLLAQIELAGAGRDPGPWLSRSVARLLDADGPAATRRLLEAALSRHPTCLPLWHERALVSTRLQAAATGIGDLRRVLAHADAPAAALAFLVLAGAHGELRDADYRRLDELPPALLATAEGAFARGLLALRRGDPDDAVPLLAEARPQPDGLHLFVLALAHLQSRAVEGAARARAVFERLAADYPSSSLARHAGSFATQLAPR